MWKYTSKNSYPNIILHDCEIEGIRIEDTAVVLEFDKWGFWICDDHPQNSFKKLLRTGKSEVRLTDVDVFSVYVHSQLRFAGKILFTKRSEVSLDDFATNINFGKWKFEFVDEYYGGGHRSVMFCGYISTKKRCRSIYTQIEVSFGECQYYWNKIYEDRPW